MKASNDEAGALHSTLASTFISHQLNGVYSVSAANHSKIKKPVIPLPHKIFDKEHGWQSKPSMSQPVLSMTVTPCPTDHEDFGYAPKQCKKLKPTFHSPVCTDTGCQSTAISTKLAYKVGFGKQDFIPVASKMNGAGRNDLGVIGAVVMEFSCKDINGVYRRTKQLCYVCSKLDMDYLKVGFGDEISWA